MTSLPLQLASSNGVSGGTTAFFALILALMILALALEEKLHAKKSVITGITAIVTLFLGFAFGILPDPSVTPVMLGDHALNVPIYIAAVEWDVISIILGASLFVDVTSRSGIFTWIAVKLTKKSGGDPLLLLVYYGVLTVLFSAFLNNVTAMIIVGSLTAVSLKRLGMSEKLLGFLLVEGLLTNVGGLLTLISSVPNIIVGKRAGITFGHFFVVAAPYVVLATAATLWWAKRTFRIKRLASDEERQQAAELVEGFDENEGIESARFFWLSAAAFGLFIVMLAGGPYTPVLRELGMGYVALAFAGFALLVHKHEVHKFYSALDWDLLAFFAALFAVIFVMEHAQVLAVLGAGVDWLVQLKGVGVVALLWASAIASSVTDNIPLAAMLAKILAGKTGADALTPDSMEWWGVIFGANLGGNITPIGSASTVVAATIIAKHNLQLSFAGFIKAALPFAAIQLAIATVYLLLHPLVGWLAIAGAGGYFFYRWRRDRDPAASVEYDPANGPQRAEEPHDDPAEDR